MIPIVDTIVAGVNKVIDKIVPDANVREQVKAEIIQNQVEWAKLEVADRDSARKREMEVKDNIPAILALTVVGLLVGGAVYFNMYPPVDAVKPIVEDSMSALRDALIMVVSYYFGASHKHGIK